MINYTVELNLKLLKNKPVHHSIQLDYNIFKPNKH